ncbi:MAG: TIR domain-containing protein, partial [Sphingobacteriales bacterium]
MEQFSAPLKVFISYSHKNTREKDEIIRTLMQSSNRYEILSDHLLTPADNWRDVLTRLRAEADVFLLLVSQYYIESPTIRNAELPQVFEKVEAGQAYLVPVILERCEWRNQEFSKWQAVPASGRPVSEFQHKEEAYLQVAEALDPLYYLIRNTKALEIIRNCRRERNQTLDLSACKLYSIPRDIADMDWITKLDLQKNSIRKIDSLNKLTRLEYLDLSDNEITTIENLDTLTNLAYLDLERNRLSEIKGLE